MEQANSVNTESCLQLQTPTTNISSESIEEMWGRVKELERARQTESARLVQVEQKLKNEVDGLREKWQAQKNDIERLKNKEEEIIRQTQLFFLNLELNLEFVLDIEQNQTLKDFGMHLKKL